MTQPNANGNGRRRRDPGAMEAAKRDRPGTMVLKGPEVAGTPCEARQGLRVAALATLVQLGAGGEDLSLRKSRKVMGGAALHGKLWGGLPGGKTSGAGPERT